MDDAKYEDKHNIFTPSDMTVNDWFEYWINHMDGVRYTKSVRAVDDIKFLTVDEQEKFIEIAKRSHNYYQYALILETRLRTGEMIGLTWDVIDWEKRTLTVNKTLEYRHKQGYWRAGPSKTLQSYRPDQ